MQQNKKWILVAWMIGLLMSFVSIGNRAVHAQGSGIRNQTVHWVWPSSGVITDLFGTRRGVHKGIDIASTMGSPIVAVDDGVVSKSYYSNSYGNVVFIKHTNNFETVYAHLKSRDVSEGRVVKQGEIIGKMGNTGDSSGVHLHFEVHQDEWTYDKHNAINPVLALGDIGVGAKVMANTSRVIEVSGRTQEERSQVNTANQTPSQSQAVIHIVRHGETLSAIALRYGTTVQALLTINGLSNEHKIFAHQKLTIKSIQSNRYVVREGDTLSAISFKTSTPIAELKNWNHLSSDKILPKQVLIVR
ncbi:peptidoglycan DD-metalloendopeptidase family protein [Bacillus sp. DNRA2]|uniref:peptidoglycan DD-metalloendopeptidase family protein n=1 Tax=Bacillus sp. DNRA2 TaxID=2723053 RepID=UPI00145CA7F3|nr:peptidoglycan DD-metalloendopeptidase family protein [Bacillus sp. DNRA2]NMD70279.1 peptidoglycan DD-metalloendopeptidase family protein [Bacillus sp. DNRA2]